MGVSPLISVPYRISEIWDLNFGNATFVSYIVYVSIEFILCVLGVGRVIAVFNRLTLKKVTALSGLPLPPGRS